MDRRDTHAPPPRHVPADVLAWRGDVLRRAGFGPEAARRLAHEDVDLHGLLSLIDRGCPPHLAARILAPLDRRDAGSGS